MEPHTLDILYDGFVEWQKKIKGYQTCPDKESIRQWEEWCSEIHKKMKEKSK